MDTEALREIVADLIRKPGHSKVQGYLLRLLTDGLGVSATSIDFDRELPEVRGRADALLGRTVFEFKTDLVRERRAAEVQLLRYVPDRERDTGQRFVGIMTDGAEFRVFMVRNGQLDELAQFRPRIEEPRGLLAWLESVLLVSEEILPEVESVKLKLGRDSVAYHRALREIGSLWQAVSGHPEATVKRDLWNRLLSRAYGTDVETPALFFQHTYLTIVAKAIATVALLDRLPHTGAALLEGGGFRDLGIVGAIESDFFDWILLDPRGGDLVMEIARLASQFRLRDIEVDILKGLYESLIDPEQRHDLGEYYTPDWLAERMCRAAIRDPLDERVIDPACGSGTFLFHAVRGLLAAAHAAGIVPSEAVARAAEKIAGIDIHPVAVIFARATYLLALLPTLQRDRPAALSIPVYLGDALHWNARELIGARELEIVVPAKGEKVSSRGDGTLPDEGDERRAILRFPVSIAALPALFDATLDALLDHAEREQPEQALAGWLERQGVAAGPDIKMLIETYRAIRMLHMEGRNHIWGYVARNLSRPIWLASEPQKADVVIGNPPWLDYRAMNPATQRRFRDEMKASGLWAAKTHGAAFDLSGYFFARCVHLYMRRSGKIAFVMPHAAMTRKAYRPFLKGEFKVAGYAEAQVRFTKAWAFPFDAEPIFRVPSCVLFAQRSKLPRPLPEQVSYFSGHLPRRDAHKDEADATLTERLGPWPADDRQVIGSAYRDKFRAGAKLDPRRLILIEPVQSGRLGANPDAPLVRGRIGNLDKRPWKQVEPPQAAVEAQFLRPVYLGECIGPYRLFDHVYAVIPWDDSSGTLLTSKTAGRRGYPRLSNWLATVESLWDQFGKGNMTYEEKINFYSLLSVQFPIKSPRVVYSKSGTNPAAAVIRESAAVIDHKLYWSATASIQEAHYLIAVLNSETLRAQVERWQSMGQWGARDFDKVVFNLPIPKYDPKSLLHRNLAAAARDAEKIAAAVQLKEGEHFTRARRRIRNALRAESVADRIDDLVARLLDPDTARHVE